MIKADKRAIAGDYLTNIDAINSEQTHGTLSRILAQPVHRDYILNAKFVAADYRHDSCYNTLLCPIVYLLYEKRDTFTVMR